MRSMYKEVILGGDVWDLLDEIMIYMNNPLQYYEKQVPFVRVIHSTLHFHIFGEPFCSFLSIVPYFLHQRNMSYLWAFSYARVYFCTDLPELAKRYLHVLFQRRVACHLSLLLVLNSLIVKKVERQGLMKFSLLLGEMYEFTYNFSIRVVIL